MKTQEGSGATTGGEGSRSRSSRTKGVVTSQLGCGLGKMHCTPPGGSATTPPSGIVTITQESSNVNSQLAELDRTCSMQTDGAYSSSSEGFCEIDKGDMLANDMHDSDSDIGDIGAAPYSHSGNVLGTSRECPSLEGAAATPLGVATADDLASDAVGAVANVTLTEPDVQPSTSKDEISDKSDQDETGCYGNKAATLHGGTSTVTEAAVAAAVAAAAAAAESQTSGDEYQVYFYDTKVKVVDTTAQDKRKKEEPNYFAGIKKMENKQDILFARAEALHAHGHTKDACTLAQQLAEEMLANPPDLASDQTTIVSVGKGSFSKEQNSISTFASTTLAKAAFLCTVLLEDPEMSSSRIQSRHVWS
ncbi:hypothetical protein NP493_386g04012 [Ridgeia piscesae]|uniref:Uncharacterized protein n=1 Tax=Ridgeia piscesae TaxID=27915 RepID=A0AAD9L1I3_RIDPI|nr:hypothetical protein NP493_386g04012 [Ridgeia piscesae]